MSGLLAERILWDALFDDWLLPDIGGRDGRWALRPFGSAPLK